MSKAKKTDAEVANRVHAVKVPKAVKVQATLGRLRGNTRSGWLRQMAAGETGYQEWRRGGFKGAWWWQYFKGQDAQ